MYAPGKANDIQGAASNAPGGASSTADMKETNSAYPACVACYQSKVTCVWQPSAFLSHIGIASNRRKTCERCYSQKIQCRLEWEDAENVRRTQLESIQRPPSPRFIQLDDDAKNVLKDLGSNLHTMVKLLVKFSTQTLQSSESNKAMFSEIKKMLSDHEADDLLDSD